MEFSDFDEHHASSAAANAEAERSRRMAEDAREIAEAGRQQRETERQMGERRRESNEAAHAAAEDERAVDERIRNTAMMTLGATAELLQLTLQRMEAVEQLRRALRDTAHPSASLPDA